MYRPKDWKYGVWREDERFLRNPPVIAEERLYNAYEAGADAMLEGLKRHSLHAEYLEDFIISTAVKADKDWAEDFYENMPTKGYLVFIPEEKNDTGND